MQKYYLKLENLIIIITNKKENVKGNQNLLKKGTNYAIILTYLLLLVSPSRNASDELKQFTSPINMQIFEDVATQQKVAKFEIIENQELIIITVFYDRNNDFIEDRLAIGSGGGSTSPIAEEIVLGTF